MKRKRKIIWWISGLLCLAGIWLLGDYVYSRVVARSVAQWEKSIQRDDDGVQSDCRSWSLDGNDTALLLVHGFNDTPLTFERMGKALHEQGYSIRAVRLPGFGVPVDQMHDCTCEQWVDFVLDEARQLRQKYSRVVIVGHSLGGAISIAANNLDSPLFDGVVLLSPGIDVANHRSPIFPTRVWRRVGDFLLRFSRVYKTPYDRNDCRDPRYRNPEYKPPFSTHNIVHQTFRLMDINQNTAPDIGKPVLMVLSRDDQVIDWVAAERFFEQLGSRNKQLRFYDSSGHALTVDYDWENVTNDIVEFVRSLEPAGESENGQ